LLPLIDHLNSPDGAILRSLLNYKEDPSLTEYKLTKVFCQIVRMGHSKLVPLFKEAIDFNTRDEHGKTPLYFAIEMGDEEMVKVLLENGAAISTPVHLEEHQATYDWPTFTPITWAAAKGEIGCLDVLAKMAGAQLEEELAEDIGNLLEIALHFQQHALFDHLLTNYPDISVRLIEKGLGTTSFAFKWFLLMELFGTEPIPQEWLVHWLKINEDNMQGETLKGSCLVVTKSLIKWRLIRHENKQLSFSASAIHLLESLKKHQDLALKKKIWFEAKALLLKEKKLFFKLPLGVEKSIAIWLPHAWAVTENAPDTAGVQKDKLELWIAVGDCALESNDFEKAYIAFTNALHVFQKFTNQGRYDSIASAYRGIGTAALHLKKYDEADILLSRAHDIQSAFYGADETEELAWELVETCNRRGWLFSVLYERNKLTNAAKSAEYFFNKAIKLGKSYAEAHPKLAEALNNLAILYQMKGEWLLAFNFHLQVRDMRKTIYKTELHTKIVETYTNLAETVHQQARALINTNLPADKFFAQARVQYEKAIELARTLYGQEPRYELALLLSNYAGLLSELGHPYEANQAFDEAIGIKRQLLIAPNHNLAVTLFEKALVLMAIQEFDQARGLLTEALDAFVALEGEESRYAKDIRNQLKAIRSYRQM
jgi:tetratricopeptide (TPR) repeat protein